MKKEIICNHPELYPTQWNQPKPDPWHGFTCDCGMNWICPICGFGIGSYPCGCSKVRESLEKSIIDNGAIWNILSIS